MKMTPILLIAVGGIIGLLGTGLALYGTYKHNINSSNRNKNIDNNLIENLGITKSVDTTVKDNKIITLDTKENTIALKEQNVELAKKINIQQSTIDNLRKENTELYSKLAEISSNIYNNVTGGDSYLSLFMFPEGNRLRLSGVIGGELANSVGKYPIENLSMNIFRNGVIISGIDQKDYNINQDYTLGYFDLPTNDNFVTFAFRIFSKNRNYLQFIIFKKHSSGKWYEHLIQLYDIYGWKLRANTYESGYPEELKSMYPQADFEISKIIDNINKQKKHSEN